MRLVASAAGRFVWSLNPLGRWRKRLAHTLLEKHRLVLVSYGLVHHGTVPIAPNVSLQALAVGSSQSENPSNVFQRAVTAPLSMTLTNA